MSSSNCRNGVPTALVAAGGDHAARLVQGQGKQGRRQRHLADA
jgi:hypothetical protein